MNQENDRFPIEVVGNLKPEKNYRPHSFMDIEIAPDPVGVDPKNGEAVFWGEGVKIACLLEDNPALIKNYPF